MVGWVALVDHQRTNVELKERIRTLQLELEQDRSRVINEAVTGDHVGALDDHPYEACTCLRVSVSVFAGAATRDPGDAGRSQLVTDKSGLTVRSA